MEQQSGNTNEPNIDNLLDKVSEDLEDIEIKPDFLSDIRKSMDNFILEFTPEKLEEASLKSYEDDRNYPENFSNWYPHIIDFGNFKHAEIIANQIFTHEETKLFEEEYKENVDWDKINEVLKPTLDKMKKNTLYNIKNGCFSNKFNFESCITDKTDLARKLWEIYYNSTMMETGGYTELVVRELIPHTLCGPYPKIYHGMPLREEIRVFYNMSTKSIEYMVDYWDYDYCASYLYDVSDRILFNWFHNINSDRVIQHKDKLEELKDRIGCDIKTLKFDSKLTGIWSIDFLWEPLDDEIYLIDMARGFRSAYWDIDKIKNKNIGVE